MADAPTENTLRKTHTRLQRNQADHTVSFASSSSSSSPSSSPETVSQTPLQLTRAAGCVLMPPHTCCLQSCGWRHLSLVRLRRRRPEPVHAILLLRPRSPHSRRRRQSQGNRKQACALRRGGECVSGTVVVGLRDGGIPLLQQLHSFGMSIAARDVKRRGTLQRDTTPRRQAHVHIHTHRHT